MKGESTAEKVPAAGGTNARMKLRLPIVRKAEDQQLVFGVANIAVDATGSPVEDSQGDVIPPAELEKAQYDYVIESRVGGTMHEELGTSTLVESFVATPEKLEALLKGLGIEVVGGLADISSFKGVGTWVGYKVNDAATWAAVKSGELAAFSIGGEAEREEVAAS